jgi:hypothetical protein
LLHLFGVIRIKLNSPLISTSERQRHEQAGDADPTAKADKNDVQIATGTEGEADQRKTTLVEPPRLTRSVTSPRFAIENRTSRSISTASVHAISPSARV